MVKGDTRSVDENEDENENLQRLTYCLEGNRSTQPSYGFKNSSILLGVIT